MRMAKMAARSRAAKSALLPNVPSEAAAAAGDLSLSTEERPMSCTSGFFTKFWLGDVPEKSKQ